MKIAVTSSGPGLDDQVDPRFGRCQYFLVVDPDTLEHEAVENANAALGGGAGIQSAQLVSEKGAAAVLTGNCGPNAFKALNAAGIQVMLGAGGTIRQVLADFKAGKYAATTQASVRPHSGMGRGRGTT